MKTTGKKRILLYLYRYGPLPDDFNKSQLRRRLGYKSDGHFHRDFNNLLNDGLIEHDKEKGTYSITDKGRKEIASIQITDTLATFLILWGIGPIFYYMQTLLGADVSPEYFLAVGVTLLALGLAIKIRLELVFKKLLK